MGRREKKRKKERRERRGRRGLCDAMGLNLLWTKMGAELGL